MKTARARRADRYAASRKVTDRLLLNFRNLAVSDLHPWPTVDRRVDPVRVEGGRYQYFNILDFDGLPVCIDIHHEGSLVSDHGTARRIFALSKAADAVLGVGVRLLVVAAEVQECSDPCGSTFLTPTHELKTPGEPFAGRRARELACRPERTALRLAFTSPVADVIGQLLDFRPRRGLLICGRLGRSIVRQDQQQPGHGDHSHSRFLLSDEAALVISGSLNAPKKQKVARRVTRHAPPGGTANCGGIAS